MYPNSASSRKIKKRALAEMKMPAKADVKQSLKSPHCSGKEKDKQKSPQKWIIPPGV